MAVAAALLLRRQANLSPAFHLREDFLRQFQANGCCHTLPEQIRFGATNLHVQQWSKWTRKAQKHVHIGIWIGSKWASAYDLLANPIV